MNHKYVMTYDINSSISYLSSTEAADSLQSDAYWPKWHSPWWHMLLLHEMGETKKIPRTIIEKFIEALNNYPLKIFPIFKDDAPAEIDPSRGYPCHCQLGNVYQVLAAWDVDVDRSLPWIRPWFLRYQMPDGGLNCDNDAYLVNDEIPSSMVGTIAAFEAILLYTERPWTEQERVFIDRGAQFLIERKLISGSKSIHNACERESAAEWTKPCFPRFYQYDALRGLNALVHWAEKTNQAIPDDAIGEVMVHFDAHFPDGHIRIERSSYEVHGTLLQVTPGQWRPHQPATLFSLLHEVSAMGEISPFLSKQWLDVQQRLRNIKEKW